MINLLDAIRTPHCTTFSIHGDDSDQLHPPAFPSIARLILQPFKALLQSDRRLVFCIAEPQTVWLGRRTSTKFSASLGRVVSFSEVAEWVTASLSPASSPLDIDLISLPLDANIGSYPETLTILRRLPDTTILTMHECQDHTSTDAILQELSSPTISTTDDRTWLCPRLQHIRFVVCKCSDPSLLHTLVARRNDRGAGPPNVAPGVSPIQSLEVSGGDMLDGQTFEKIEFYLGSHFRWEAKDETEDAEGEDEDEESEDEDEVGEVDEDEDEDEDEDDESEAGESLSTSDSSAVGEDESEEDNTSSVA